MSPAPGRRAAVVGSPVDHSLSPVLHGAAFAALGLGDWRYDRIDCDEAGLPALVAGIGPEWVGLSVTMPGKRAALRLADEVTPRAETVGAANTLVPLENAGWRADCTDVDGVLGALRAAGGFRPVSGAPAVVLGAGGTALAVLVALSELDVREVALVVRDPARAADTVGCARRCDIRVTVQAWSTVDWLRLAAEAQVVISTVPAQATEPVAGELAAAPCLLDVIYHPWPTPLAHAVAARGGRVATGLDMLLHQAFGQCEQFTGKPAPRQAMRDALRAATGNVLDLPLD